MFETLAQDERRHPDEQAWWFGHSPAGEYCVATCQGDDADCTVHASFTPWQAGRIGRIELLDFRLGAFRQGRDLLARARRVSPLEDVVERGLRDVLDANRDVAFKAVAAHSARGAGWRPAQPVFRAGKELAALLVERPYPLRQLLEAPRHMDEEHWVAEVPGAGRLVHGTQYTNGTVIFLWSGNGAAPWTSLSDDAQAAARKLWFRPSDVDIDPGLEERYVAAYRILNPPVRWDTGPDSHFLWFDDEGVEAAPTLDDMLAGVTADMEERLGRALGLKAGVGVLRARDASDVPRAGPRG